jgi:hypothetical protein
MHIVILESPFKHFSSIKPLHPAKPLMIIIYELPFIEHIPVFPKVLALSFIIVVNKLPFIVISRLMYVLAISLFNPLNEVAFISIS